MYRHQGYGTIMRKSLSEDTGFWGRADIKGTIMRKSCLQGTGFLERRTQAP